jgi:uncharacterized protein YaiL (DUF2058 family)
MGSSLRDQLLKAGLVSEKQVKDAERQLRKPPHKAPKSAPAPKPTAMQQAQAAKAARDRELNRRRAEKAEAKARAAQIRQIIDQHRLPRSEDGSPFYFQDGTLLKRIHVDAEQRRKIIEGSIAIVRYEAGFALLPPSVAEKVRERDPRAVVNLDAGAGTPRSRGDNGDDADGEAYKGFEVPDDLMW